MSVIQTDSGMSPFSWPSHDPWRDLSPAEGPEGLEIQRQLGNLWRHRRSAESIRLSDDLETFQGEVAYRSVPPKRSYVVRVVCVEVRKGEPRPFSLDDLTE
ncbi:MAG: hypothetical protein WBX00_29150 [Isosphaeraceae bacterium]|jgi:hypothetical protein